jgi:hypothetical protein
MSDRAARSVQTLESTEAAALHLTGLLSAHPNIIDCVFAYVGTAGRWLLLAPVDKQFLNVMDKSDHTVMYKLLEHRTDVPWSFQVFYTACETCYSAVCESSATLIYALQCGLEWHRNVMLQQAVGRYRPEEVDGSAELTQRAAS